jgi:uncharacterized HAD superfamily protein
VSRRFRIGLDLDGVVYNWDKTARYMIRTRIENRGETPPPELLQESADWDWIQNHVSEEDWRWLWREGTREGVYRYGHVIKGAIEGVQKLAELGDVTVITSRPKDAVNDTLAWLALFFNRANLAGINILSDGQPKSSVEPEPDLYVDDGIHNFVDILSNTTARVIKFEQPWNAWWWHPASVERFPDSACDRFLTAASWRGVVSLAEWARENRPGAETKRFWKREASFLVDSR